MRRHEMARTPKVGPGVSAHPLCRNASWIARLAGEETAEVAVEFLEERGHIEHVVGADRGERPEVPALRGGHLVYDPGCAGAPARSSVFERGPIDGWGDVGVAHIGRRAHDRADDVEGQALVAHGGEIPDPTPHLIEDMDVLEMISGVTLGAACVLDEVADDSIRGICHRSVVLPSDRRRAPI